VLRRALRRPPDEDDLLGSSAEYGLPDLVDQQQAFFDQPLQRIADVLTVQRVDRCLRSSTGIRFSAHVACEHCRQQTH
jgi:hypothetical protein